MEAEKSASGIIGAANIFSSIGNVYSIGNLNGNSNNGIISLPNLTTIPENSQIKNAYYIDNVETGTNLENDNTTKVTSQHINSQEFVNELNKYVEENPVYQIDSNTSIKLSKWKLGENGYPIFEYK